MIRLGLPLVILGADHGGFSLLVDQVEVDPMVLVVILGVLLPASPSRNDDLGGGPDLEHVA